MFNANRYTSVYFSIVTKAQSEPRSKRGSVYYESHHIIPTALGGLDEPSNQVLLTAREHIFCHRLLTRMTSGKDLVRMKQAFFFIVFGVSTFTKQRVPSSNQVATARVFSQQARDPAWCANISKSQLGRKHSKQSIEAMASKLRGRLLSEEHKAKIRENHTRSAAKWFTLIMPNGETLEIHNLRLWCSQNDVDYQNAYLSAKNDRALRDGRRFIRSST